MKKVYSPAFKAQVVLEILKEEKSITQLSSERCYCDFLLIKNPALANHAGLRWEEYT
jgi:hypothetical protein